MKYSDLAEKTVAELTAMLKEKKTELFTLKIKKQMMQLQNTSEVKVARKDIAKKSIDERCCIIVVESIDEAINLMNEIAPEHLEVMTQNPFELLPKIKHAGAIFLGENTPEPIGDYIAGPNHTLPTGGTAKFYSPLGVENFMKKSSIIAFSRKGINEIGEECALIANTEGLTAHEQSVRVRVSKEEIF